ncbi:MAG: molybdopterin-dependent oxidoreductase, partial [Anaerolineaceae bacterium]|nr:molybdopterin-dependent oxidoreductase [Anaerolineaceae bacterium]
MKINLVINNQEHTVEINPDERLLSVMRKLGYLGQKSGGCVRGECGACTVLMDEKPINSCMFLTVQMVGHKLETIEGVGSHPDHGWNKTEGLDPIQQAFIEVGAIQCGYCTPAMVLVAKSLLRNNNNPDEAQIRDALSGVMCRCTAFVKPVSAIMRAASILRGEKVPSVLIRDQSLQSRIDSDHLVDRSIMPDMQTVEKPEIYQTVGKPEYKVDGVKLAQGKPAFVADITLPDMLIAKVLYSSVAHANITKIDVSKAKALPGVAAVLTWQDLPRVVYSTAGQSDPIPGPLDTFSLDRKVRFVGDRVAFVAAETVEIALQAIKLIEVEYEKLPVIIDPRDSMKPGVVKIHDEKEYVNFADSNAEKNLAAEIRIDIGDVENGFQEADKIFEEEYVVPKVQQAHIEPHVAMTYWDEDDRLVIRTSTQVPFHVRRMMAPVLGLPVKRIRVIKPRIGGGFGGKQEVLIEDVAAHLT